MKGATVPKKVPILMVVALVVLIALLIALRPWKPPTPLSPEALVKGVKARFVLRSPAFANGTSIPRKYTCDGADISPPLEWGDVPEGAVSLVLIVYDPDAPRGIFYHWILYNIPPTLKGLPEGVPKDPETEFGLQGKNDFGYIGYGGPCPPPGRRHRYVFLLLALDKKLELPPEATVTKVMEACRGHVIAYACLVGVYEH